MTSIRQARRLQLVLKITKYCNLRCTYCYEFNELGDKTRMSLGRIDAMFCNVASAIDSGAISGVECIWHGGEPFLIPLEYFRDIGEIQQRAFPSQNTYQNLVQTNLTILPDRHLEFLKHGGFFQSLGVSFDVFGDHRVDMRGKTRDAVVLNNLEKLMTHNIHFGAISVLTRGTHAHARQIQKFWSSLGTSFRFLPFYLSVDDSQSGRHGLTGPEIVSVMTQSFLDWLAAESPVGINPMCEYLVYALEYMAGGERGTYNPVDDEVIFVVNVNGDVFGFGHSELYQDNLSYGNLFNERLVDILQSPSRMAAARRSIKRMDKYCGSCPYFGYCPGHPVADASSLELHNMEQDGCNVRHTIEFIIDTLQKSDLAGDLAARFRGAGESLMARTPAAI